MIKVQDPNKISLGSKKKNDLTVFLDMDGVIVNWTEGALKTCGFDHKDPELRKKIKANDGMIDCIMSEDEIWKHIDKVGAKWWADLDWLPWGKELYNKLDKKVKHLFILSSPSHDPSCCSGKMEWLNKHLDTRKFFFGPDKYAVAGPNKLLIDDSARKIEPFEEAGGLVYRFPEALCLLDGDIDIDATMKDLFNFIDNI